MEFEDNFFDDGLPKGYYRRDNDGKYVLETNAPWAEKVALGLIVSERHANLEEIKKAVIAGLKSPLCYHMEVRQMTPHMLAKATGIAVFRIKRHLHPEIFSKLKSSVLDRYAKALVVTLEELKRLPTD